MEKKFQKANELKYKNLIIAISILIPVVVAILFRIRLEGVQSLTFLPPIYAAINGYNSVILLIALWAIKNRKITLHEQLMKTAIGLSLAFLVMYVVYHLTSDPTPFGGEGWVKSLYYFILFHISFYPLELFLWFLFLMSERYHNNSHSIEKCSNYVPNMVIHNHNRGNYLFNDFTLLCLDEEVNIVFYAFLFTSDFFPQDVEAQCSMCRAVLESEEGQTTAKGINDGIVYLMAMPYILVAGVGYVVYRMMYK